MSAYRPYPKYKPSGVEWLGDVPDGWTVSRIKNVATINASKSEVSHLDPETEISFLPMEAVGDDGSLDTSTTRQLGDVLTGYTYVRENDVLVAKITPCFENGKGCIARGLNNGIGFATTEVVPIRPNKRSIPEFLYFLLHGLPFRKVAEGSMYGAGGQKRVSDTFVAGYSFALPPLPEQHQIASFLDRECGKLDALQAKQERLIELLKEKRQALISHAVTRGLDPTVKLKPSGIDWLGDVPVHWTVPQLGKKITLQRGYDITKDLQTEGNVPVVSSGGISSYHDIAPCRGPGVVVGRKGSAGAIHWIECPYWPHDTTLFVSEFKKKLPRFVYYKLLSMDLIGFDTGSANPTLNRNNIHPELVSWPSSLAEQHAIVAHLDDKCGKIDQLKAKAERGIELLKERRSALISATVTGKIDVRQA